MPFAWRRLRWYCSCHASFWGDPVRVLKIFGELHVVGCGGQNRRRVRLPLLFGKFSSVDRVTLPGVVADLTVEAHIGNVEFRVPRRDFVHPRDGARDFLVKLSSRALVQA